MKRIIILATSMIVITGAVIGVKVATAEESAPEVIEQVATRTKAKVEPKAPKAPKKVSQTAQRAPQAVVTPKPVKAQSKPQNEAKARCEADRAKRLEEGKIYLQTWDHLLSTDGEKLRAQAAAAGNVLTDAQIERSLMIAYPIYWSAMKNYKLYQSQSCE